MFRSMKALSLLVVMILALTACKSEQEKQQDALYQQQMAAAQAQTAAANAQMAAAQTQPQQVAQQPQYINNPDPMAGVLAGVVIGSLLSDGSRYDGHNGYSDSHYRGPSRRVVNVRNVTNVTNVVNPAPGTAVAKVNNPGDAAAAAERSKMDQAAKLKADQAAKNSATGMTDRRAALEASKAKRISSAPTSGFNGMSRRSSYSSSSSQKSSSSSHSSRRR